MTRVLVLLLVVPPLLMPPGMCVCRYFHGAPQPNTPITGTVEDRPALTCTCESCRESRSAELPEHHTPATPPPTDHLPGCPAAVDAAQVTAVTPVVAEVSCELALAPLDQPTLQPSGRLSRPTAAPAAVFPSRALAHRVLLI